MEQHLKSGVSQSIKLVTSISVGVVIQNAILATTPPDLNLINKISVRIGSWVISSVLADLGTTYVLKRLDLLEEKPLPNEFKDPKPEPA